MTLYRLSALAAPKKSVEVLDEGKWRALKGTPDEILIPELVPRTIGDDEEYRYVVTDEPSPNGEDFGIDIASLQKRSHRIAEAHGFWEREEIGTQIALIHSEVSEALEEWRNPHPNVGLTDIYYSPEGKPEGFPIELADVIIRVCNLGEHFHVDLTQAIRIKEAFNKTRPFKHGGKRA